MSDLNEYERNQRNARAYEDCFSKDGFFDQLKKAEVEIAKLKVKMKTPYNQELQQKILDQEAEIVKLKADVLFFKSQVADLADILERTLRPISGANHPTFGDLQCVLTKIYVA